MSTVALVAAGGVAVGFVAADLPTGAALAARALIFVALGEPMRPTVVVVGFGVAQLATSIPVTPGGLGFVEGGMVGAFVTFGVPLSLATTAVLLYRVVSTWLPTLVGVPALLRPTTGPPTGHGRR